MDQQQYKTKLISTFDTVATGYDNEALRFFRLSADHMASLLRLGGGENVLDVGCGTGHVSVAVANRLPNGRVTAVDFSTRMLKQARSKAASLKLNNVDFVESDFRDPYLTTGEFDIAVCAFSIFFVDDMKKQLERIASTVKSDGRVMVSTFQDNFLFPLREMFFDRIEKFGVNRPPMTWKRISKKENCQKLFEQAGLREILIEEKNFGYFLENENQWWEVVWNAGMRGTVTQLNPQDGERFKREHLQEVKTLQTPDGIWLDVGVLFASGVKS